MPGYTLKIPPVGPVASIRHERMPPLGFFTSAETGVGGPIEMVPYFFWIERDEGWVPAYAYRNEEGKLKGQPVNHRAQELWLKVQAKLDRRVDDVLVGTVVVFWGDWAFMEEA